MGADFILSNHVDETGHIVVPPEIRNKLGLVDSDKVDFLYDSENKQIIVRASVMRCRLCNRELSEQSEWNICKYCATDIVEHFRLHIER